MSNQYQDKIKVYNASGTLPDIIVAWGNDGYMKPLIANNALAELNKEDFANVQFIPAALDGFSANGKLYGLTKNSDFWVLFYNKKIFADNGLEIPKTESDMLNVISKLKQKKIIPIAMDGRDGWPSGIWFDTMLQRVSGSWDDSKNAMSRKGSFNEPAVVEAAAM
ncbi:hypothetical protein GCM10008018_17100 [Paenibacillus marchantiophytorum]|uniref:Extracellular solute-binding protein n=1 Tax=Paenibacillus marchantiophytorum TaxID=1619310 RepID=A0ABQ2BSB4_9BACL|nr:extracellular solute-binding protein [Paenibacillus marchantiophytorum]GGI46439.1 hypothetical protein GCM10008018_17100 [Paenibacillus marchantiophytorum]